MTDVLVGRLVKPFGIRGELKLHPAEDFWEDVLESKRLTLRWETDDVVKERDITFTRYRPHGNCYVVCVDGVNDRNSAETFVGRDIYINSEKIDVPLPDQKLPFQVLGAVVKSEDGEVLGEVTSVIFSAAHDVYEVGNDERSFMVPAVSEFIVSIDEEKREIVIRPLPGLIADEK